MNGALAQIISLVAHGNLFLSGGSVDLEANSTFRYDASVKFIRFKSNQDTEGVEVADSVSNWLSFLRSIKATRLWNIAFEWQKQDCPEYVAAAFANGAPNAIQADLPKGFEIWYPLHKTGGSDKKRWLVEYRGLMFPNSQAIPVQKMSLVRNRLKQAVSQAEKFANRSDVNASGWADWFTKSLEILDSPAPTIPYHPDMLPASGFDLDARQILASAVRAYVFGGMGSWNDMLFEKPEITREYERITQDLYEALKLAFVMVSNSFATRG